MKQKIWALSAALLAAGCTTDTDIPAEMSVESGNTVVFSSAPTQSRTEIDEENGRFSIRWSEADQVGIYSACPDRSAGDNFAYSAIPAKENATQCVFSPAYADDVIEWQDTEQQSFYAYAPYAYLQSNCAPSAFPISVPAVQEQIPGGTAHLSALYFMKAEPVTLPAKTPQPQSGVSLKFHGVPALFNLRLKMDAASSIDVPIKEIRLVSDGGNDLAYTGTIDLTAPLPEAYDIIPVSKSEASKELTLTFSSNLILSKAGYKNVYAVVAPGSQPVGCLRIELRAIDNSVATIDLPKAVDFKSNRSYTMDFTVGLDDFVAKDSFDVSLTGNTFRTGEEVTFEMSGLADRILFYSGEEGNDYAYHDRDRIYPATMKFSFSTLLANAGGQNDPLKLKYSTNYSGDPTEEAILAADWTDISDRFAFANVIGGPAVPSGNIDITDLFPEQGSLYLCYFYTVKPDGSGRTQCTLSATELNYEVRGKTTNIFTYSTENIKLIVGASYADNNDKTLPSQNNSRILFNSTYKPAQYRYAYATTNALTKVAPVNVGPDAPIIAKRESDPQVTSYVHIFDTPGSYNVTFVAEVMTITGTKQVVKDFTVTITE